MKKYLNFWRILSICLVLVVVGCSGLGEVFNCSNEEAEKLNSAAHTQSEPRVLRAGVGAFAEGGDICTFESTCIEEYVAMKAEYSKELMYWRLRVNGKLPGFVKDALRKEGVASKNIETTDRGIRLHSRDIQKVYWCAWRNDPYFCKRFGLDASKRNIKRTLEPWELKLDVTVEYEEVYGEKYAH